MLAVTAMVEEKSLAAGTDGLTYQRERKHEHTHKALGHHFANEGCI